jgi:hypothetical protein
LNGQYSITRQRAPDDCTASGASQC